MTTFFLILVLGCLAVWGGIYAFDRYRKMLYDKESQPDFGSDSSASPQEPFQKLSEKYDWLGKATFAGYGAIVLLSIASTSLLWVQEDHAAHLRLIYGFSNLEDGRIIAVKGEKGPQAEVIPEGFHFRFLINVLYEVEQFPLLVVPEHHQAVMVALDGAVMDDAFAPMFPTEEANAMFTDAQYFIENGGRKGPQATTLGPGKHRINRYLWGYPEHQDRIQPSLLVEKGHVAVIKSNVRTPVEFGNFDSVEIAEDSVLRGTGSIAARLAQVGEMGVWRKPLGPNEYYINTSAFEHTIVDNRMQSWEFKGGFTPRFIDLDLDKDGNVTLSETDNSKELPTPDDAAGPCYYG